MYVSYSYTHGKSVLLLLCCCAGTRVDSPDFRRQSTWYVDATVSFRTRRTARARANHVLPYDTTAVGICERLKGELRLLLLLLCTVYKDPGMSTQHCRVASKRTSRIHDTHARLRVCRAEGQIKIPRHGYSKSKEEQCTDHPCWLVAG